MWAWEEQMCCNDETLCHNASGRNKEEVLKGMCFGTTGSVWLTCGSKKAWDLLLRSKWAWACPMLERRRVWPGVTCLCWSSGGLEGWVAVHCESALNIGMVKVMWCLWRSCNAWLWGIQCLETYPEACLKGLWSVTGMDSELIYKLRPLWRVNYVSLSHGGVLRKRSSLFECWAKLLAWNLKYVPGFPHALNSLTSSSSTLYMLRLLPSLALLSLTSRYDSYSLYIGLPDLQSSYLTCQPIPYFTDHFYFVDSHLYLHPFSPPYTSQWPSTLSLLLCALLTTFCGHLPFSPSPRSLPSSLRELPMLTILFHPHTC